LLRRSLLITTCFEIVSYGRKNMVRVTIELSKLEIEMLLNCIEAAIDTEHVPEESEEIVKELKEQLSKYL